jgi:TRAP-type mannitol/chloroaromatic compound transport system permease small subunit
VRVDVIYAGFSDRLKSLVNVYGSLILGLPLCWVILTRGLWSESSPFNLALLNFEVTQQGFGMYVKYLMSGFLVVFAVSMLFQFASFMLDELNKMEQSEKTNSG